MLRLSPHLTFDGHCRAAFQEYRRVLGGVLTTLMSYGESPMAAQVNPRWHDRIAHATLLLDDVELVGADLLPQDYQTPQGFFVTLTVEGSERGRTIFDALSEGDEFDCRSPLRSGRPASGCSSIDMACLGKSTVLLPQLPPNKSYMDSSRK
jgi:PhnB protein